MNIGIISASNKTINKIIEIASTIDRISHYRFINFPYTDLNELPELLAQHIHEVDGWLFSGPNPYAIAKSIFNEKDNASYCNITGNEIYKSLLEYIYENDKKELYISIDCPFISDESLSYSAPLEELAIPKQNIFLHEYTLPFDYSNILQFHKDLYESGKTTMALTTIHKVYLNLKELKIPVKRIYTSDTSIRQALNILDQKLTGLYFKRTQVGLAIFKLVDYSSMVEKTGSSYKLQKLELELKSQLLDLCQKVNGYLSDKGNGYYEIFSSRGLLEDSTPLFQQMIAAIQLNLGLETICGIGFGTTVFSAQLNAHRALTSQKGNTRPSIVIVNETGQITHFYEEGNTLTYRSATKTPELVAKLQTANVSITTYNKMLAIIKKMNLSTFTAAQLAQQLNVTERNVQRILVGLNKSGLIVCCGQENLNKRGRPTKIYQLN